MGQLGSHPNIVTVHDLRKHEDQPYTVIELVPGGDIEGLIEKAPGNRLSLEQAIGIIASPGPAQGRAPGTASG